MSLFTDAIETNLKGCHRFRKNLCCEAVSSGICSTCPECRSSYGYDCEDDLEKALSSGDVCDEGSFSWSGCDCCGTSLAGDRYDAHCLIPDDKEKTGMKEIQHMDICTDCLMYLAHGDEPENWEK